MIVIVCGGRKFGDQESAFKALDEARVLLGITGIAHGGAGGADTLADEWATSRDVPCVVYPAHWDSHGRAAGPIRNQEMLSQSGAEAVLAFPGGAGTRDMCERARNAGLLVYEFTPEERE